jgi:hypothetical protein
MGIFFIPKDKNKEGFDFLAVMLLLILIEIIKYS